MEFGYLIGWIGVAFGILVPIPQLLKIRRTGEVKGVSRGTYFCLLTALICYLYHSIYIGSIVFIVAQSIGLFLNSIILYLLIKSKGDKITA